MSKYCIVKATRKENGKYTYSKLFNTDNEPTNEASYGEYLGDNVVIDIDNHLSEAVVDKWLKEFGIVTQVDRTQHGAHYWFKRPIMDETQHCKYLLCGVRGDYRSKEWVTRKRDNYVYQRENDDIIAEYPWFLKVIGSSKIRAEVPWLDDPDLSRNDSLRDAMLQMNKYVDDISEHIKLINRLTLAAPLPTDELESTILRKESIEYCDNNSNNDEITELTKTCLTLISEYILIKHNGQLYYFNGEIYEPFEDKARQIMARGLAKNPTTRFKKDVLENISDYIDEHDGDVNVGSYVAFNDCLYNTDEHKCEPFNENIVATMKLKYDYPINADQPNMVDEIIDKLLCSNKDDLNTFYEYIGYCLARNMKLEKALMLNGNGQNGKSSVLNLIEYTFKGCCNQLPFKKLFAKNGLQIIADNFFVYAHEMTSDYITDATTFKEVLSNNAITVEDKYVKQHVISNYNCKFIYANNGATKMDASSVKAINRRLLHLQFDYDLRQDKYDAYFEKKWLTKENAERLLYLAIEGLKRLQQRGEFKLSERSQAASDRYLMSMDNVKLWFSEYDGDIIDRPVDKCYTDYKWFVDNDTNTKKVSKEKFKEKVCELANVKISFIIDHDNGKRIRIFVPLDRNTKSKK